MVGASGTLSALPIIVSFCPALSPSLPQSASSLSSPPLTPNTFCRSGGTPVSEKSWVLNTEGGCSRSTSTSLNTSFCHLTSTVTLGMVAGRVC